MSSSQSPIVNGTILSVNETTVSHQLAQTDNNAVPGAIAYCAFFDGSNSKMMPEVNNILRRVNDNTNNHFGNDYDKLPNVTLTIAPHISPEYGAHSFRLPQAADNIVALDLDYFLPPNASCTEPLPDNFLETLLLESAHFQIAHIRYATVYAHSLVAMNIADEHYLARQRVLFVDYPTLSRDQKLAITRRGFSLLLRNVFDGIPSRTALHATSFTFDHALIHVQVPVTTPFQLLTLRARAQLVSTEQRRNRMPGAALMRTVSPNLHSDNRGRVVIPSSDSGSLHYAMLVFVESLPGDPVDDPLWHPFDRLTMEVEQWRVSVSSADEACHENWVLAGFKGSPPKNKQVYCLVFCHRDRPHHAIVIPNTASVTITLQGLTPPTRNFFVNTLQYSILRPSQLYHPPIIVS